MVIRIAFLIATLAAASANAEDPACKPVFDSMTKLVSTPSHAFLTKTAAAPKGQGKTGDAINAGESINTGTARYLMAGGNWMVSPVTTKDLLDQEEETRRNGKEQHCSYVREETVAGETAAVYTFHNRSDLSTTDMRIWISKRAGLPLKDEIDLVAVGSQDATHYSSRYVYDGIRAPAGVKQ